MRNAWPQVAHGAEIPGLGIQATADVACDTGYAAAEAQLVCTAHTAAQGLLVTEASWSGARSSITEFTCGHIFLTYVVGRSLFLSIQSFFEIQ